ncbi:hypothetical protein GCM10009765_84110 [Fodinicola feengrottensis]|uniref:Uncharacterized protein n=2 Tax=Fodinicola feengrottensis TaxID=435914 RepID=A0ABP4VJH2_9ACTN
MPGESLERLRTLFYRIMDLPLPYGEPPIEAVPIVKNIPKDNAAARILQVECVVDSAGPNIQVVRFPAELQRRKIGLTDTPATDHHLVSPANYPLRRLRSAAAVLTVEATNIRQDSYDHWLTTTIANHPACMMAVLVTRTRAVVRVRNGPRLEINAPDGFADAAVSATYAWLGVGGSLDVLAAGATFQVDDTRRAFQVRITSL